MVFKCQEDSFLKEVCNKKDNLYGLLTFNHFQFTSKVVSCEKTNDLKGYEIILEDTILFPEGGGQPCDYGFLNEVPVEQVLRRADKAIHVTDKPLNVGDEVKQAIDWNRRFDHMQQHSGQHLITAVLDRDYKYYTISWYLGEDVAYVELGGYTKSLNQTI